ncbi:MAG: ABC transporter ATP-binding protein [Actinomycetota bacterium]|nr:ABC transporter ATP-binding protein [Actinomycetota bacterium]
MPESDDFVEFGKTAGGGGAGRVRDTDWPNPAAHAFDDCIEEPGSPKPDPILVATGVQRHFGGLTAVDVATMQIQRGAITALIGPNGAGKTTFFNLLSGFDRPDQGEVYFDGARITNVAPHLLAKRGMVRTFQLTKVLAKLSVLENMKLAGQLQAGESMWKALLPPLWKHQEKAIEAKALEILDEFNMVHMQHEFAGALSGGQRKLLEMARSMMTDPQVIMLDEPMAGVNPALTQSLLGHVKRMRSQGITVVFVEHDMDVVRDISDWVVVMAEGIVVAEGRASSVGANPAVIDAYLGTSHAALTGEHTA